MCIPRMSTFPTPPHFNVDAQMCLMTSFKKKWSFQSISLKRSGRYHYSDIEIGGESVDMLPVAMQRRFLFFFKEVSHAIITGWLIATNIPMNGLQKTPPGKSQVYSHIYSNPNISRFLSCSFCIRGISSPKSPFSFFGYQRLS